MTESAETAVQTDNVAPVTDSANPVGNDNVATDTKSESQSTPSVEMRDGKTYINGTRVYTREDVNKIGANTRREVEQKILSELNVDSIDSVKSVVSALQETVPGESNSLNVESLRDAVKKREATVEELQSQVAKLKTDLLLKDHMSQLVGSMPSNWNPDQKQAVVDLMRARNMLVVEGDTFAIKSGEDFLTTDGETPDYKAAVEMVGKQWLGLPFGKQGVDIRYGETTTDVDSNKVKPLDENRVISDAEYRSAYLSIRQYQPTLGRDKITDSMVRRKMEQKRQNIKQ